MNGPIVRKLRVGRKNKWKRDSQSNLTLLLLLKKYKKIVCFALRFATFMKDSRSAGSVLEPKYAEINVYCLERCQNGDIRA